MGHPIFTPSDSAAVSRAQSVHHHDVFTDPLSDHESLRLIGTTRFEPLSNVKAILITGGAGFMLVHVMVAFTTPSTTGG